MSMNLEILDDQKLYKLCKLYGEQTEKWRYKFMGLLPEVYRRKLYEKKGFDSVFEFAKKLAGLSEEQVRRVLNLEKKFEETPVLKNLLTSGEVSVNKLARVASIATQENQEALAEQVKILPQAALETLVRDEKSVQQELKNENGLDESLFEEKSVRTHNNTSEQSGAKRNQNIELELSDEVRQKLLELQQKEIDVNTLILEMLQKRELEIAQEKEQIAEEMSGNGNGNTNSHTPMLARLEQTRIKPTRHIPIKIKKLLHKEHGNKCSIPNCKNPAEAIHHTQRFSLSHTHDPRYLAPLCRNHHIIAHSIDLKFQQKRMLATS